MLVLIPNISRPYVELHYRVFCQHHGLKYDGGYTYSSAFPYFDKFLADALFHLIILNSPFFRTAKYVFRTAASISAFKQHKAPETGDSCATYPAAQLTVQQAKRLVHKTIRLSSKMFPKWDTQERYLNVYIARHDLKSRTFDFVFPGEFDKPDDFSRFKAEYKGRLTVKLQELNVKVFHRQKEATILDFGDPDFVKGLQRTYVGDAQKGKSREKGKSRREPQRAGGQRQITIAMNEPCTHANVSASAATMVDASDFDDYDAVDGGSDADDCDVVGASSPPC